LPNDNQRIIQIIQQFCTDHIFEQKTLPNGKIYEIYRVSWLEQIGNPVSGERRSKLTLKRIFDHVKRYYPNIQSERKISNTGLAYDMFYSPTNTGFQICLLHFLGIMCSR
jgi:hypothetical protein